MIASHQMPGHLIRRLHQQSTQLFSQRMKEAGFDLTPVQFAVLDGLSHAPGIDQAGLAQLVDKDPATIGGVVDRLEQKGLLVRVKNREDRRARVLEISAEGRQLLADLMPVVAGLQKDILGQLDTVEYREFIRLATKAVMGVG